jgi:LacI family transcriptional regulator
MLQVVLPMKQRVTIKDVAKAAHTSVTTVSLILNGKGKRFSKETREKVLTVQQRLGYLPNFYAQSLVGKRSATIGVIVPDISNPFFSAFIKGVEDIAYQHNVVPLIYDVGEDDDRTGYYMKTLTERTADGFVLAAPSISQSFVDQILNKNNIPYVATDQTYLTNESDEVLADNEKGGYLATNFLVSQGHKRIAMIMPTLITNNLLKRFNGYRDSLDHSGIAFDESLVFHTEFSRRGGYQVARKIIASDATAVFCVNDDIAVGLYRGLKDMGKKIPDDYSIVGYDDIDWCNYVEPRLTTIHQPAYDVGAKSAAILLHRIKHPETDFQLFTFDVSLVIRESTKKVNELGR